MSLKYEPSSEPLHLSGVLEWFLDLVVCSRLCAEEERGGLALVGSWLADGLVDGLGGCDRANSHGARPVHLIITMIKWTRTSRLSIIMINSVLTAACCAAAERSKSPAIHWRREFKLPWREAGPPNHHDDKVDSDQ